MDEKDDPTPLDLIDESSAKAFNLRKKAKSAKTIPDANIFELEALSEEVYGEAKRGFLPKEKGIKILRAIRQQIKQQVGLKAHANSSPLKQ